MLRGWAILQLLYVAGALTVVIGWIRVNDLLAVDPELAGAQAAAPLLLAFIGCLYPIALLVTLAVAPAREALRPTAGAV